ncbi:hypothetical protein C8J56DRAFT_1159558 [Mycena floridula]|nr:hypothetical protein C8J56DRAFT_1159558 [Mycena floridula]
MTRPPPLQLRLDNMLPNLGIQPPKSLFTRIYETNWRGLVLALSVINALRFALQAVCDNNSFHDVDVDHDQHLLNLAHVSFTLSVMYTWACIIEIYGVFTSLFPRQCLIRAYTVLSFLSILLVTAAGMINTIAYFMFADDLVKECVALASTGKMDMRSLFRSEAWRTNYANPIPTGIAQTQCLTTFHKESATQVLSVILFSLIPSTICFLIVWTWGRQVRDSGHAAYLGKSHFGRGMCCFRGLCCFGGCFGGGAAAAAGARHGGRSGIRMEEYSPLYHAGSPAPDTAHSHHATTQSQPTKPMKQVVKVTRATIPVASMSNVPPPPAAKPRPPPLPVAPIPQMTQVNHQSVSATENFHTMSPFSLESPGSSYGVSPGPPSFAGGYDHGYDYYQEDGNVYQYGYEHTDPAQYGLGYVEEGGLDVWSQRDGDISLHPQAQPGQSAQPAQPAQAPPARGRGEYWFV